MTARGLRPAAASPPPGSAGAGCDPRPERPGGIPGNDLRKSLKGQQNLNGDVKPPLTMFGHGPGMDGPSAVRDGDRLMAEAARRYQQTGGTDLVRRLMARPVRLERQVRTRLPLAAPADVAADAEPDAAVGRLEAELQVMKAVVRAQRQEVESLRAQRQLLSDATDSDDVRATRERWASLVDSLIIRAR